MNTEVWIMIGWLIAASVIGFTISAIFAGKMNLGRHSFLIPYISIAGIFLVSFFMLNEFDLAAILVKNWPFGILAGGLLSIFLVKTVRSQPLSRHTYGRDLVFDITWAGLAYGIVDALFLNVMPVLAVWAAARHFAWEGTIVQTLAIGLLGLLASLLVTLAYHLGYPEFRNKSVLLVLAGNAFITLAFLLSGSPLGSVISHTAMHVAAVLQGSETTIQLPPHYGHEKS